MQRLRKELGDLLVFGEFCDTLGVDFSGSGNTRCSVHRDPKTAKRAAVAVNFDAEPREVVIRSFERNGAGPVRVYRPFAKAVESRLPVTLVIPAERFVVVVEA